MRACVQRVREAHVSVAGDEVGRIASGLVVLLGVAADDTAEDARQLATKIISLRIFEDDEGKMNRSLIEVGGALLAVSQFTLLGDCRKGRRPSFTGAAAPSVAERLYEMFVQELRVAGVETAKGIFGAHMQVALVNDGPVTLLLDSGRTF